jgi:hypothetical protein
MIKRFEKFGYEDVFSDHIQMTKKMSEYLMKTLRKFPNDMWLVTFTKGASGGYYIKNHYTGYPDTEDPNGLFLNYDMLIKIGDEEIHNERIGIVVWLCYDEMVKYVVMRKNSDMNHFLPPNSKSYPNSDADMLFYVTIEKFIETIKKGLTLEKLL